MKFIAFAFVLCLAVVKTNAQVDKDTCTYLVTINNASTILYEKPSATPKNEIRLMNLNEPVYVVGKTGKFAVIIENFKPKYLLLTSTTLTKAQTDNLTPNYIDEKILDVDNTLTPQLAAVAKEKDSLVKAGTILYIINKFGICVTNFTMTKNGKNKGCTIMIAMPKNNLPKNVYAVIDGVNNMSDAEATKSITCPVTTGADTATYNFPDLFNDKSNVINHLTITKITVELGNGKKEFGGSDLNKMMYVSPTATAQPGENLIDNQN